MSVGSIVKWQSKKTKAYSVALPKKIAMPDFYSLKVVAVEQLTPNSVALSFEVPIGLKEVFSFTAGQYITLKKELDGKEIRRAYSISSAPGSGELTVGIKKMPGGTFSVYANNGLRQGDFIDVMPPDGRFVFEPDTVSKTVAAFAAGSGITPIMSIAKTVLGAMGENKFVLAYGNQSPEETMYHKEIMALQETYADRFFVQWIYSRSNEPDSLFGRIEGATVNLILKNKFKDLRFDAFYLCGPEAMVNTVSNTLQGQGIDPDNILFELFTTSNSEGSTADGSGGETKVTVMLDGEETEFSMDRKEILLDAVLNADIDAPYSCQGGVCSSCIAKVTEGKAEMVKNQILTDAEIEEGLILSCQTHALTPILKVDFDDV